MLITEDTISLASKVEAFISFPFTFTGEINRKWPQLHVKYFNIIQLYNAAVKRCG